MIPSKYEYVWKVCCYGLCYRFKDKPRKIRGGYMDKQGNSYIGKDVCLSYHRPK